MTYIDGRIGKAAYFDGVSSYITVPHDNQFNLHVMTLSAWVYDYALSDSGASVILLKGKWSGGEEKRQYSFFSSHANTQVAVFGILNYDLDWEIVKSQSYILLNQWVHIVVSYDGQTQKVYINGELNKSRITSFSAFTPISPDDLTIGVGRTDSEFVHHKNGLIDALRIYNRALSKSEIQQLYQMNNQPSDDCWAIYEKGSLHIPCIKVKGPFAEDLHYEADMQYEPLSDPMTFQVTGAKPK